MSGEQLSSHRSRDLRVGFALVVLAAVVLPFVPAIRSFDLLIFDAQMRTLRQLAPRPAARAVVIVGIDDHSLDALPEPRALWHHHLGQLFTALAGVSPAAVAVDITLPERSYDFLVPGRDRELLAGILSLRQVAPLVLGVTVDTQGRAREIYPPFLSVAGPSSTGFVIWQLDADRRVRRFTERLGDDGSSVPTLVGQLARALEVDPGEGFIDYTVGEAYRYVPLHQVLQWSEAGDQPSLEQAFADAVVLVGSVLPFVDRHHQPVALAGWEPGERFVPGVLIHAQALRSMLVDGLLQPVTGAVVVALGVLTSLFWWLAGRPVRGALAAVLVLIGTVAVSTWLLRAGLVLPITSIAAAAVLAVSARVAVDLGQQAGERRRLRRAFAGYVSPPVLQEILDGHLQPGLGGERRRVCVIFSDIRGFTELSEAMQPEQVIGLLNRYFAEWTAAIQSRHGTLDKFIGDGVMAFFGAPKASSNPCRSAFGAVLAMLERLRILNRDLEAEGLAPLQIGIGMHVGEVVVGHVGSEERHEYTAIGDPVNLASRLEGLTKQTGYPVICSREVSVSLGDAYALDPLGMQPVRGHSPVEVFGWPPQGADVE